MRVKLDSGIVEDIYSEDDEEYMDEVEDVDSDDSDVPYADSTYAKEISAIMQACIQKLELPRTLFKFLNLNRDL